MVVRHFIKHLPCSFFTSPFPVRTYRFLHHLSLSPSPHCLSSPKHSWMLNSIIAKLSTSSLPSSEETTLPDSFTAPYLSVSIRCRKDISDMLSEALLCFGASSTSVDEHDRDDDSDEICITSVYFEEQDVDSCILHAADSIGMNEKPDYDVEVGEQYNWIKKSQESFHPTQIYEGLWIVPEWRSPPDDEATNIILNPGLAFGTGDHPTTKLCLLLLHGLIKGGERFLDYGTGSGILAIAALKFGAALSVGIDVDPQAITSARQNADLNNIHPDKMRLHLVPQEMSAMSEKEKYDVIIANILLNPLLDLANQIVSYAKPGAVVGLSGILSEQVPQIIKRYSELLEDISVSEIDDWACVRGTKK